MSKQTNSGEYSSSSSDSPEVEWSERKGEERESNDWFNLIETNCTKNTKTNKKLEQKKDREVKEQKMRDERELNPYMRCRTDATDGHNYDYNVRVEERTRSDANSSVSLSERNSINAKLIKAELMGNQTLVNELKDKLKRLESTGSSVASDSGDDRNKREQQFYCVSEKRPNDETMSLKEMYFREKKSKAEEENKRFVATTSKSDRYPEQEYEDMRQKHKKRRHDRNESIIRYVRHEDEDRHKCRQCVDNIDKHLILYNGTKTYVTLTSFEPFVKGLCHILSKSHNNVSMITSDEECLAEINERKHQISKFFDKQNLSVIFMETYFKRSRHSNRHLMIECIPIKRKYETEIKIFLKKAIMECEGDWAMNKQVIEINGKSVTKLIPKGLSYFWATIGPKNDGFAHVIENEETFSHNFGKEIIGGLLDIEPNKWLKPKRQNYEEQYKRIVKLKNEWNQTFA